MFDEYGNFIPVGTAPVATMGDDARRNAAGVYTGQYPPLPPTQLPVGGPNTGGLQLPPITPSAANPQPFQMPGLGGQQVVGLGGATDYSGGFNTGGPVANPSPFGPTMDDFPMEFRSLEGIQEFDMPEEADIPLDFDLNADAAKGAVTGATPQVADAAKSGMGIEQAGMAASGILGVAGGITDIIVGHKQMKQAQDQQVKQQHEIDKLKASQPSLSTPAEYYERVKNAYDTRLMQMRTEDINRNLANTTAAATSFGSRGLGALAGATSAANRAQRAEVLEQQQKQTAALGDLASAQERSTERKEARNVRETNYAQQQLANAQALEQQSRQQMMGGIASTVGGVAQTAMGFGAFGPLTSAAGAVMDEGGKVQKTPGKFSHAENEMAVITEEGDDTGIRVTGGEYVLNPDQAKSIKRLVESKDKEGLMKFMDDLLDEPQFA